MKAARKFYVSLTASLIAASGAAAIPPAEIDEAASAATDPAPAASLHTRSAEEIQREAASKGFFAFEQSLRDRVAAGGGASAAKDLAAFYAAHKLHVEALAALKDIIISPGADVQRMRAKSQYAMGRYGAAIELLDDEPFAREPDAQLLLAAALAHEGGYERALSIARNGFPDGLPDDAPDEAVLLLAEAALARGDLERAGAIIDMAKRAAPQALDLNRLRLLQGALDLAERSDARTLEALDAIGAEPWSAWAALKVLTHRHAKQKASDADFAAALSALALRTDHGAVRREIAWAHIGLAEQKPLSRVYVENLRAFIDDFRASDDHAAAEKKLRAALTRLFDGSQALAPMDAAQIFYENIDYAPPGRDGDAMIRSVAERLFDLDLGEAAVELLEHQVFNRLRGAQRSTIAADLADGYLTLKRPSEALRVLRSTRIAGLSDAVALRRKLLEARALEQSGDAQGALQRLNESASIPERALLADIQWRLEDWPAAGRAYQYLMTLNGVSRERAEEAFIRAGVSFSLAEDKAALGDLLLSGETLFVEAPALAIVRELQASGASARGGDNPEEFMDAYWRLYQRTAVKG
ncbi:MAG: hypothetical protein AAGJ73_08405 [Pseudomonadota bacterium]